MLQVQPGDHVIDQDDDGDNFYVIDKYDVYRIHLIKVREIMFFSRFSAAAKNSCSDSCESFATGALWLSQGQWLSSVLRNLSACYLVSLQLKIIDFSFSTVQFFQNVSPVVII